MNKAKKIAIIIALCLIAAGLMVCACTLLMLGMNLSELRVGNSAEQTYEITDGINSLSVSGEAVEVLLVQSSDKKKTVAVEGSDKMLCTVETVGGELKITQEDRRAWYDYLAIGSDRTQVTISLPQGAYESLTVRGGTGAVTVSEGFSFTRAEIGITTGKIEYRAAQTNELILKTTTGSVTVMNAAVGKLSASATTGSLNMKDVHATEDIELSNTAGAVIVNGVTCRSFTVPGGTGNATLKKVVAAEKLSVERSTGAISLERCDGGEIDLKTTSGSVTGSLNSGKTFDALSSSGKVIVPASTGEAPCVIRTDTGKIAITVEEPNAGTESAPEQSVETGTESAPEQSVETGTESAADEAGGEDAEP